MKMYGFESYGGPEVARFLTVPAPHPAPGDVLIDVIATSVNPGDIKVRLGARQGAFPVDFPMAMGREAAGRVVQAPTVGPGSDLMPGMLVFGSAAAGTGTFAEQALLTATSATPAPTGLDPAVAASIPVAVGTAADALGQLGVTSGSTLLVVGAGGGVGSSALSLARARGAVPIGVASASKRGIVEAQGGVFVESGPGWVARVTEVLSADGGAALGRGRVDAVFDLVGGEVLTDAAQLLSDNRGSAAANTGLISVAEPQRAAELGGAGAQRRRTREVFAQIAAELASGAASVVIGERCEFAQAPSAVAAVETGHVGGKVVIEM